MTGRRTYEIGIKRRIVKSKNRIENHLSVFAAQEISQNEQQNVKHGPNTSADTPVQPAKSNNTGTFRFVLILFLLIGIIIISVVPLTNATQWFANTQFAQCIGLNYGKDQINLLNDKILDMVLEIAKTILAMIIGLFFTLRGN